MSSTSRPADAGEAPDRARDRADVEPHGPRTDRSGGGPVGGGARNVRRAAGAEAIGTFFLVYTGTATAVAAATGAAIAGAPANSLSVALAFGLVLVALVGALAPTSGAHLNPAVTIALASVDRFPWRIVPAYLGAQLLGALAGAGATWLTLGTAAREVAHLGATHPREGVGDGRALLVEAFITFLLVFVIVAVTSSDASPAVASTSIGSALVAAVLIGGPSTGGAVNPVRALGPMVLDLNLSSAWVYVLGPIVGGLAAAQLHTRVVGRASEPAQAEDDGAAA